MPTTKCGTQIQNKKRDASTRRVRKIDFGRAGGGYGFVEATPEPAKELEKPRKGARERISP